VPPLTAEHVVAARGEWDTLSTDDRRRVTQAERELVCEIGLEAEDAHKLAMLTLNVVSEHDAGFDLIGRARSLHAKGCEPALIFRLLRD
jgi:hypothetical protein